MAFSNKGGANNFYFKNKTQAEIFYKNAKPKGYWTVIKRLKDGYSVNTQLSKPNMSKSVINPVIKKRYNT